MTELEPRVRQALDDAYGFLQPGATVETRRAGIESLAKELPKGIELEDVVVAGVPAQWVRPEGMTTSKATLLVHGGGFHVGSPLSHRDLAAHVALASHVPVLVIDYRLSPEHVFPAAFDDVKAVYRGLIADGADPSGLSVLGDSSGGGLALSALMSLKAEGVPMPAGIVTMSAWVDHTMSSESVKTRGDWDPYQSEPKMRAVSEFYRDGLAADDPRVSAIFGDATGLPPMLMQVGTNEPLFDDTNRFAEKARAAGVDVEIQVEEGMPHMHQMLLWNLPEAADSARRAGEFIRSLGLVTTP